MIPHDGLCLTLQIWTKKIKDICNTRKLNILINEKMSNWNQLDFFLQR